MTATRKTNVMESKVFVKLHLSISNIKSSNFTLLEYLIRKL